MIGFIFLPLAFVTPTPTVKDTVTPALKQIKYEQPTFPDRTNEYNKMVADKKAEEDARAAQEAAAAVVVETPTPAPEVAYVAPPQPVDTSDAKMFIYMHESGNNPGAVNSGGCRGLGQACPGSKLPCGNDYACQDAFFTSYMLGRYGSWENARAFWLAHNWW